MAATELSRRSQQSRLSPVPVESRPATRRKRVLPLHLAPLGIDVGGTSMAINPEARLIRFASNSLPQSVAETPGKYTIPELTPFHATLRLNGFHPSMDVLEAVHTSFLQSLENAANGQESDIAFIRHRFPKRRLLRTGVGQATVMGGTEFSQSTFVAENGQIVAEIDRTDRKLKKGEDIIATMVKSIRRWRKRGLNIHAVSGNIAMPMDVVEGTYGAVDGIPTPESQGVKGRSINLVPIGATIREDVDDPKLRATVVNDTIAMIGHDGSTINGTGANKGLRMVDESGNIVGVNLESGGQKLPPYFQELIKKLDALLPEEEQNKHEFEKLTSGKYLPMLYNLAIEYLRLPASAKVKEAKDLDPIADSDTLAGEVARTIFATSAMLEAAQYAGIYKFLGRPITLIGDGSILKKAWYYQDMVQYGLQFFGVPEGGVTILTPKDVAMQGAINILTGSSLELAS